MDGVAYMIYVPPGVLALLITFRKVGGYTIYEGAAPAMKPFFTFPDWTWGLSVFAFLVVFVRAFVTERAWWKAPDAFGKLKRGADVHGK